MKRKSIGLISIIIRERESESMPIMSHLQRVKDGGSTRFWLGTDGDLAAKDWPVTGSPWRTNIWIIQKKKKSKRDQY